MTFFMAAINIIPAKASFDSDDQATIYTLQARLRELGYFNYRATGMFGEMTKAVLNTFRLKNSLATDNLINAQSYTAIFKSTAIRKPILTSVHLPIGPQTGNTIVEGGSATSFKDVDSNFPIGAAVQIQDYITAKTIYAKRTGGENHVVAVLAQNSTTADLKAIFGSTFTWEKRSVVAIINGQRIAAAMSVTQKNSSITLNIYFTDSASDISGTYDIEFAQKILQAVE